MNILNEAAVTYEFKTHVTFSNAATMEIKMTTVDASNNPDPKNRYILCKMIDKPKFNFRCYRKNADNLFLM